MTTDAMTSDERVWEAIRLGQPDRVPVVPTLLPEPAAGLAGVSQAAVAADNAVAVKAVFDVFDSFGGWDNPYPGVYKPVQLQLLGVFPMKMRIPGVDLADDIPFQLDEMEILKSEDYETIAEIGFKAFYAEKLLPRISDLSEAETAEEMRQMTAGGGLFLAECAKRDTRPLYLANQLHPFFKLSLARSLVSFTQDLYYDPDPIERAITRMTDDLIEKQVKTAKLTGIDIVMLCEERAGAFFFPPAIFERFWWPYTKKIVEALWSEGIVTLFHLDTCWDKNLHYFKELPRGSAILELDSTTDLFLAKEVLHDHLCLKGDVPASLLSIGTPEEVRAYCRERVEKIGGRGGYILGSGCSVPPDAKPDNFRAMIESVKG